MKILKSWLEDWVDLKGLTPQQVADILTFRGIEVEEITDLAKGFEKVVSAKLLSRDKHPEADRLSVCKVQFDEKLDPIEIVCGAQNMKAGDIVALAQVGASLPNGMKIERGKIRGIISNGMLCSEEELNLADESEGILILPVGTTLGRNVAELLDRNDVVFEIKVTANRGDCLSHRGVAREIASSLQQDLKPQRRRFSEGFLKGLNPSSIRLGLEEGAGGLQFAAVEMKGVKVGPSPAWLRKRIEGVGSRSINNVVDATNYLLFDLGHPVHAYDRAKLKGASLKARLAKSGETLLFLDGVEGRLSAQDLVIADAEVPVGLAGVMGGGGSEVSDTTTNILLECAEFDPTTVRRGAFRHQRRTDAAQRFEKGIDSDDALEVLSELASIVGDTAGGEAIGFEWIRGAEAKVRAVKTVIEFPHAIFARLLGIEISKDEIKGVLESLECNVELIQDAWKVIPPTFRKDLNIAPDFVEEVARCIGYDRIPETVPALSTRPRVESEMPSFSAYSKRERAKDLFVELGFSENLSLAFQSKEWVESFGFKSAVPIQNPLTADLGVLAPSLTPGLVQAALYNQRHHFGAETLNVRLFELRPVFMMEGDKPRLKSERETNIVERFELNGILMGGAYSQSMKNESRPLDFYDLKGMLEMFFERFRIRGIRFRAFDAKEAGQIPSRLHTGQCLQILAGKGPVGVMGRMHPRLEKELKLKQPLWIFELNFDALAAMAKPFESKFEAIPEFPGIERDFAFVVDDNLQAERLVQTMIKAGKPLAKSARIFDHYRGEPVPKGKVSLALRVQFLDAKKSLVEAEVEAASQAMVQAAQKDLGAELR